jgi:hypothetical protein
VFLTIDSIDLAFDEFNIIETLTNENLLSVGFLTSMEVRM